MRIPEAQPAGAGHRAHRGEHVLSRVAESIYWMKRYVERAENTARFIDVNLNL
ncbi:MAG: alpha-E domain-containing protein, partial [Actinomycetota bacterium]